MKTYIQAIPQLRGPKGFPQWMARLPVADMADNEPEGTLPIGGLLLMREHGKASRPAFGLKSASNKALVLTALFSLFSKKSYRQYTGAPSRPAVGPWLRHLLG